MVELIIAISMWCGAIGSTSTEVRECRKALFSCVRKGVMCSSCWSVNIPTYAYDSALGRCIDESLTSKKVESGE